MQYSVASSGSSSKQSLQRGGGKGGGLVGGPTSFSLFFNGFGDCEIALSLIADIFDRISDNSFVRSSLTPALEIGVMDLQMGQVYSCDPSGTMHEPQNVCKQVRNFGSLKLELHMVHLTNESRKAIRSGLSIEVFISL